MLRQDAIKSITAFLESGKLQSSEDIMSSCYCLLVVVGQHTRAFKETNVNIMKAIIQLFLAVCDCHEDIEKLVSIWVMESGVDACMSKIADKKLSAGCKTLLSKLCVLQHPRNVLLEGFKKLKMVKAPLAHEEYLVWVRSFCSDFGSASIGSGLAEVIPLLLEVIKNVLLC